MQLNTEFIRPARGTLTARGELDRRGGLTAYAMGTVTDEGGKLVARATGIWAIRKG
jgi:acyl-coenzyme A thioesterase PaaI-like protein